ncbi:hypothetical protein [Caballeronia sp. KNU42]
MMTNSNEKITGQEAFFGALRGQLSTDQITTINQSPLLVSELLAYGAAVAQGDGKINAFSIDLGSMNTLEFKPNGIVFGQNWLTWSTQQFVGNLSHEIGHFINQATDASFASSHQIDADDPDSAGLYVAIGTHFEGEAAYNNYLVQQQIVGNGGQKIDLNGSSGNALQATLDSLHSSDVAKGVADSQDRNALIDASAKIFAGNHPSGTPAGTTYADYFMEHGAEMFGPLGSVTSAAPGSVTSIDFFDPKLDGNFSSVTEQFSTGEKQTQYFQSSGITSTVAIDQFGHLLTTTNYNHASDGSLIATVFDGQNHMTDQDQFYGNGSEVATHYNSDNTRVAITYDASGNEIESAQIGTTGQKTLDNFYDATSGRQTEEDVYASDHSHVNHYFNADGSQSAAVFNNVNEQTESVYFNQAGVKTQDVFYDGFSGRETQENDINTDGSQIDHVFNQNGTQTAAVFNAAGHETELATFASGGSKTQDIFYDASSGRETQENDFRADGSQTDYLFNADGTQNAYVFGTNGHETEAATFGTNGVKTQDIFYDASSGRETQENDIHSDGSQTDYAFAANGTQTATVFNAGGHETEQASFDTSGKLTKDLLFSANGTELQETDYTATGGVAHIFNPDGTQNSAVFDTSGHISEYATYAKNGTIVSDAYYDKTGHETEEDDYTSNQITVHQFNADNSQTATVYTASGHETEYASFDKNGKKVDDYFFDASSGRNTEHDSYGNDGSMVARLFASDSSQSAIYYNAGGQETEYDAYNSQGKLTGFTQFTYMVGGGYDAIAYGPTGYETGWADYNNNNTMISSSGGAYNFTLDGDYGGGADDWDFGWDSDDSSFGGDFGYF